MVLTLSNSQTKQSNEQREEIFRSVFLLKEKILYTCIQLFSIWYISQINWMYINIEHNSLAFPLQKVNKSQTVIFSSPWQYSFWIWMLCKFSSFVGSTIDQKVSGRFPNGKIHPANSPPEKSPSPVNCILVFYPQRHPTNNIPPGHKFVLSLYALNSTIGQLTRGYFSLGNILEGNWLAGNSLGEFSSRETHPDPNS